MSTAFHSAAAHLSSAPDSDTSKASNDTKLELYGLFKYVTTSQGPTASRPSLFDFTGRAKWDAWSQIARKYGGDKEDAEKRYMEIARSLGWNGDILSNPVATSSPSKEEEIDWENNDDDSGSGSGAGGMGPVVSTMGAPTSEEQSDTLHDITLSGDVQKLQEFLDKHADVAINGPDEFGYTALQLACDRGNLAAAQLLLQRGADPNLKDPDDMSAMELAKIARHEDIVKFLGECV